MKIYSTKSICEKLDRDLNQAFQNIKASLLIVQIGSDVASSKFIELKKKKGESLGIQIDVLKLSSTLTESDVIFKIRNEIDLYKNSDLKGVLIQSPLPNGLDFSRICLDTIPPHLDVDGLTIKSRSFGILPAVVESIKLIQQDIFSTHKLIGSNVLVINNTTLLGIPLSEYFISKNATVVCANKYTKDLKTYLKQADLIVTATGVFNLFNNNDVKKRCVIIDAGYTEGGRGDLDTNSFTDADFITKVPGSVGPLTILCLFENLLKLTTANNNG